jgi:ribosomal-protein-serine acetyltransferase
MGGYEADEVFSYKLSENTEVRLLEERHAQELTDLTDRNREHLRKWFPWWTQTAPSRTARTS